MHHAWKSLQLVKATKFECADPVYVGRLQQSDNRPQYVNKASYNYLLSSESHEQNLQVSATPDGYSRLEFQHAISEMFLNQHANQLQHPKLHHVNSLRSSSPHEVQTGSAIRVQLLYLS